MKQKDKSINWSYLSAAIIDIILCFTLKGNKDIVILLILSRIYIAYFAL